MPTLMPTLAESERPDDDAGTEVDVVVLGLAGVLVELRDAVDMVDAADAADSADSEGLEDTIEACPSVRRLLESLQQLAVPGFFSQHQVPEESGGHATIPAPPPIESRFCLGSSIKR